MFELGKQICELSESEAYFLAGLIESTPNNNKYAEKQPNNYPCQSQNLFLEEDKPLTYDGKTIQKRKDRKNSWYIRFYKNSRQITVYGKTQKEVIKNYKEAKKEKPKQKPKEFTLKQWFEKFIELYKTNKFTDTTIKANEYEFKKLKKIHNVPLKELNQFEIQEIINKIPHVTTRSRVFILLNAMLEKAYANDLIPKNIMKLVDKPKYKAKEKTALTQEEENMFVYACNQNYYGNYYLICLYQGLRKGEARALKVNDIDFKNNTLRIDESFNTHTTRTNTKNEQSNRIMPLFERTKNILQELVKGKNENDLIFNIGINKVDKALKDILKNTKIKKHITTHILRHTFITRCQENNIPLYVVQSWVGHEKGSVITTKIYTHLSNDANKKFVDIINNINKWLVDTYLDT